MRNLYFQVFRRRTSHAINVCSTNHSLSIDSNLAQSQPPAQQPKMCKYIVLLLQSCLVILVSSSVIKRYQVSVCVLNIYMFKVQTHDRFLKNSRRVFKHSWNKSMRNKSPFRKTTFCFQENEDYCCKPSMLNENNPKTENPERPHCVNLNPSILQITNHKYVYQTLCQHMSCIEHLVQSTHKCVTLFTI